MTIWVLVWKTVLILTLSVFALMTVFVIIGGAFDIRQLFRRLRDGEQEE